jgi:hypothetical protein
VRGGEHDAAHLGVVPRLLEGGDQLAERVVSERIASLGIVEHDRGDLGLDLVADLLERHSVSLIRSPLALRRSRS